MSVRPLPESLPRPTLRTERANRSVVEWLVSSPGVRIGFCEVQKGININRLFINMNQWHLSHSACKRVKRTIEKRKCKAKS
jgi:hypothetical protein